MKLIKLLCFLLFITGGHAAFSQKYYRILNINYTAGKPFGGVNNFIDGKAFDGISIDGRYFLSDRMTLGIATGWNTFSKKLPRQVYQTENGNVSAVQTRFFRSIPILVTAHYYPNIVSEKRIKTYAGLGLGAYQVRYERWLGAFIDGKENWNFGIRPEVGILVPITEKIGFNANVKYNYAIYKFNEIDNLNFVEGAAGVYFHFY